MDVTETLRIESCVECQVLWYEGQQQLCDDLRHRRTGFDVHRHRSVVVLPDGTSLTAVSFDPRAPFDREQTPDFGLYFDPQWQPPWAHAHLVWPDFDVPDQANAVL